MLAYADGIDFIGPSKGDVTAAFSAIEWESTKMGLAVNESTDNCTFDTVKEFVYLVLAVPSKN